MVIATAFPQPVTDTVQIIFTREALERMIELWNNHGVTDEDGWFIELQLNYTDDESRAHLIAERHDGSH